MITDIQIEAIKTLLDSTKANYCKRKYQEKILVNGNLAFIIPQGYFLDHIFWKKLLALGLKFNINQTIKHEMKLFLYDVETILDIE